MVILAVVGLALGGVIHCDPLDAERLLAEARIDEDRAPLSHPELVPGLALASPRTGATLRDALQELCAGEPALSLAPGDSWEGGGWGAHTLVLERSETRDCTMYTRAVVLSVAVSPATRPVYTLRGRLPVRHTPIGDCGTQPRWREERLLQGEGTDTRVVLNVDHRGPEVVGSSVVVRRAARSGWTEFVLREPAPARYLAEGGAGPRFSLVVADGTPWVVESGDRGGEPCAPIAGQRVWYPADSGWASEEGRAALSMLAQRGLWRLAGSEAWLHILGQDSVDDRELVGPRRDRLERRVGEPLWLYESAALPDLNPGFVVIAPAPWPTEEAALAAVRAARRVPGSYVKRAWSAPDACGT